MAKNITKGAPAERASDDSATVIAGHIAAVLNHPATPADLRQGFKEALNEFENTIDLDELCFSRAALTHALELRARDARGKATPDLATQSGDEQPRAMAELAAHISAVLNHPLTPESVYDDLWNAVNNLATPESFYNSASYIEGRLSGVAELPQEGGVH